MVEVKIREIPKNIIAYGVLGTQSNQRHSYLQLYYSDSGQVVPDGIYNLKQGEQQQMCNITDGQARGVDWVDPNQPIFLD